MNFAQKKVCKPYVVELGGWCLKGWWCYEIYKLQCIINSVDTITLIKSVGRKKILAMNMYSTNGKTSLIKQTNQDFETSLALQKMQTPRWFHNKIGTVRCT